ncbi:ABC transporter permease [Amycolatopsis sp.]|uniref:ABC transporter permease n=1 Tax=Amycolatopsis sp. TaxID=37632 RepID=UPI002E06D4F2|nr:FtsX-like permease family protein [Amycolatopsis sp.]
MFRMALRTLRLRKGGFIATFVAVFFGAVIAMACGGLMETGIRTAVPAQRLAAAPIVVTAAQTFQLPMANPGSEKEDVENGSLVERVRLDAGLAAKIAAIPGVTGAVGEISFPATVGDAPVLGHAWSSAQLTPYHLTSGAAPAPGEVVVPEGRIGDRVDIGAHGKVESFRISGTAGASTGEAALFFSAADASRLSGHPGLVDSIGVFAPVGTDLSAALKGVSAEILTGDDRGVAEHPETLLSGENLIVLAAVSGGMGILVAMFVVASTLALSIQQRQRELALLRAIGTTPRQLRRMVIGEALVVAVLAIAVAIVPGSLFGRWLFDQLTANGVVPPMVVFHQGSIPVAAAAGAAMVTALVAAFASARRAGRTRPTEALADAAVQRHWLTKTRVLFAILALGGGLALSIVTVAVMTGPVAASTAGPAVMLWAIGLAMLSPGITNVLTSILQWPLRAVSGVNGYLAMLNVRARTVRVAAAITPIMLATGISIANIYLQTTQDSIADRAFTENLRADAVISSQLDGLSPDLVGRVQRTPGVAGASEYVTSQAFITAPFSTSNDDEGWPVTGVTAAGVAETNATAPVAGKLTDLSGNTVALPETIAADVGVGVGDAVTLRLGDGAAVDVRVVALFAGRAGFENFLMPAQLLAPHTTEGLAPQILVRAAPGTDVGRLTETLRTLTASSPGVVVGDRAALVAEHEQGQDIGAWVNYLLLGMIMAYTVISVVNTLVMSTARRRREFGLQRLTGSTRAQIMRMMGLEGVMIAVVGVVLGTIVAAGSIVPFCLVVSDSVLPSGPVWIYLAVVGLAGAIALLATLMPTWAATRVRPAEAALTDE